MAQPTTLDSARRWATITPDDDVRLAQVPYSLYVAADGNAVLKGDDGVEVTFPVTEGQTLHVRPFFVMEDTTATLIALYNDVV